MIPYLKGRVTRQAHVGVPEGTYEEEYARSGFFGRYAHLYRTHAPVEWTDIEGDLKPRAFDLNGRKNFVKDDSDFLASRELLLYNDDVEIAHVFLGRPMSYFYRNADADEIFFIHEGGGVLETDFGPLNTEKGDYLVIPRGTVYRWKVDQPTMLLNITSFSEVNFPEKGMLGQHALFDPAMIRVPTPMDPPKAKEGERFELRIRRAGKFTRVYYPFYPIDVVGWKGTLTAWQLNVRDIRPVSCDTYHLPPSAHTTFVANGFVVCSFLPRPLENGDPEAMKVPFYHSNIDYDEVLFYHAGEFFSRAGISTGMMTFHPQGIHHGPQADAVKRTKGIERTHEIAVMIDTQRPLLVAPAAESVENRDYWKSWMKKEKNA